MSNFNDKNLISFPINVIDSVIPVRETQVIILHIEVALVHFRISQFTLQLENATNGS
ncbi:hypothetical protein [Bacillus sp. FJAT-28004]|uniref:hypothetical protein n=1 Tax=Bacillus sp. FJAT-28004 TaxID=1679165 RepID=UPI001379235D|nr:hypothetical protein [Bacillus sp. FJAT-28004]